MDCKLKEKLVQKIVDFLKSEKPKNVDYQNCYINFNIKNSGYKEIHTAKISFIFLDFGAETNISILYSINRIDINYNDFLLHTIRGDDKNYDFISNYITNFFNKIGDYKIEQAIELLDINI